MIFPGSNNQIEGERLQLQALEEARLAAGASASAHPHEQDAGLALDTARIRDRLDWEHRCASAQRRINGAYQLELKGERVRRISWQAVRWCLVVLLMSCFIGWTGSVALLLTGAALAVLLLGVVGGMLGGAIEFFSQQRQWSLLARGAREHLDVYDPSLQPDR